MYTQAKYRRRAEESLANDMDDLPQNSINNAILSFVKDFEFVWNLGRTI